LEAEKELELSDRDKAEAMLWDNSDRDKELSERERIL